MKLKEGDIFTVPINENSVGLGQIIYFRNKSSFMVLIFKDKYDSKQLPDLGDVPAMEILFLGYTLDAKFYHKHWTVIGNSPVDWGNITLPNYKLGSPPGEISVLDFKGSILRKSTITEFETLSYLTVIAPVVYENALKAFYHEIEWQEYFDKIRYSNT